MGEVQGRCWVTAAEGEPAALAERKTKSASYISAWPKDYKRQGPVRGVRNLQNTTADGNLMGEAVHSRASMPLEVLQCHPGIMLEIASHMISSPQDLFVFRAISSFVPAVLQLQAQQIWSRLFQSRWPAFFESLQWTGTPCWRRSYRQMLAGDCECLLEVYHREKKAGFTMSAMSAYIRYDRKSNAYVTKYQSVNQVPPEHIPVAEEHRLRFCPASARERLQPGCLPLKLSTSHGINQVDETVNIMDYYPYKVLEGLDDLEVGSDVELQWKMQAGSPFGLWFGNLESLVHISGTKDALATVTFNHFPSESIWYRLQVRVGGSEIRRCDFGGYTGGLRRVTESEKKVWMCFFPGKPLCKLAIQALQEQNRNAQTLRRVQTRM
eukprot:TRINITY_DN5066_c0_g2_i1.p1 TRINITY_DN5066_c0_g2~~TRINITY_DN5066_c0_g2_i1.p1  ORF type:complete len:394 (+),score=50.22 TRINITY_DN5066_c0_g2_i1:40-1182(+)